MPPDFDEQVARLLHRYADTIQPTRDTFAEVKARLLGSLHHDGAEDYAFTLEDTQKETMAVEPQQQPPTTAPSSPWGERKRRRGVRATAIAAALIIAVLAGVFYALAASQGRSRPAITRTATATTTTLRPRVADVEWRLEQMTEDDLDVRQEGQPVILQLRTQDATVTGSSGCNTYRGTYAAEGVALRVRVIGSTLAACAAPIMAFEQTYLQALAKVEFYGYSNGALWLTNGDGRTSLEFRRDSAPTPTATAAQAVSPTAPTSSPLIRRIADRTWTLTRYTQDGWEYPLPGNGDLTLWLRTQDARVGGALPCLFIIGTYDMSGETLRLDVHWDRTLDLRCNPPASLLRWEYVSALGLVETYRVEDGQLVLASADGKLQLVFRENPCDASGSFGARMAPPAVFSGTPPPATPCPSR
jgi:heat shock protein HslJ